MGGSREIVGGRLVSRSQTRRRPTRNRPAAESLIVSLSTAFELNALEPVPGMAAVLLEIRRECGPNVLIRVRSDSCIVEVIS